MTGRSALGKPLWGLERRARSVAALEDPVRFFQWGKQAFVAGDGFRTAEQQHAPRRKRVVESRDHAGLEIGIHVDEQVAAGHQVHARERGVADQAVRRKGAEVANVLADEIAVFSPLEEALAPIRRQTIEQGRGIASGPGRGDRGFIDVSGKKPAPVG